jgi:hypothetical protein
VWLLSVKHDFHNDYFFIIMTSLERVDWNEVRILASCEYQPIAINQKINGAVLKIDHKIPASKGWINLPQNFITACFDCDLT